MRRSAFACLVLAAAVGQAFQPDRPGEAVRRIDSGQVLLLPGEKEPCRLRLEVVIDGKSPALAWETFLDHLFDHFDTNGDGWLSRAEAARIMPLPLPGGKELTIDFARLDTERKGKVGRARLKAFCRANGFTPVVVVVTAPSADDVFLANRFSRRLDRGNGKFTREDLRRMPNALRRYDLNDDEYLDLGELLAWGEKVRRPTDAARVKLGGASTGKDGVLRIDLGAKPRAILVGNRTNALTLVPAAAPGGLYRLRGPTNWALTFRAVRSTIDVRSAGDFLLAQFKAALGDAATLSRTDLEEDAALAGFLELFPYADRNGDGRLSLAELKGYLALVELATSAQVQVTVRDRDRNPFDFLDSDGDGRLSYREQISAPALLLGGKAEVKNLPWQFDLRFSPLAVKSLGGVAIPIVKRPRAAPVDVSNSAPAWFRAMDRNGDGVISPREFIGPPEVFRKLDADGDGVISPEEAARATRR
jgi:Ca2+-binding EF-hand superfamily protein